MRNKKNDAFWASAPMSLVALIGMGFGAVMGSHGPQFDFGAMIYGIIVGAFIAACLLAPAIIAYRREHHQKLAIFVLNLFTFWTLIGWIVCLVWSCTAVNRTLDGSQQINSPSPNA